MSLYRNTIQKKSKDKHKITKTVTHLCATLVTGMFAIDV